MYKYNELYIQNFTSLLDVRKTQIRGNNAQNYNQDIQKNATEN